MFGTLVGSVILSSGLSGQGRLIPGTWILPGIGVVLWMSEYSLHMMVTLPSSVLRVVRGGGGVTKMWLYTLSASLGSIAFSFLV